MKFKVQQKVFADALSKVNSVVAGKSVMAILGNVLIDAKEDGKIRLVTTDLDMTESVVIEAEVKEAGKTTLPAKRLTGIVKSLTTGDVNVTVSEDDIAKITNGNSSFKVIGASPADFPYFPNLVMDTDNETKFPQATMKTIFESTIFAASLDETRRALNGLCVKSDGTCIDFVATDGRRLAIQKEMAPFSSVYSAIIPTRAVNEFIKVLGDEGECKLTIGKAYAKLSVNNTNVTTKLIDGSFPNYEQVIPINAGETIEIDRDTLVTAMRRVSLVTSDKICSSKFAFTEGSLTVSSKNPDIGDATDTITLTYNGKSFSASFNPKYVIEGLKALTCEKITWQIEDGMSPSVIKSDNFKYVMMPLREG